MNILMIINAVVFGFLTLIWTKKEWYNFALKAIFFALTLANLIKFVK
jgi:hypothetical protein